MRERQSTCKVWACLTDECPAGVKGYLVTEPGILNRMIAFVRTTRQSSLEAWEEAHNIAMLISGNQTIMELYPVATDLRGFGKSDSNKPMPGFVYALWCQECEDASGEPNWDDQFFQPNPLCKFRLADMVDQSEGKYGHTFPIDDPHLGQLKGASNVQA